MNAVQNLCKKCVLLDNGRISYYGGVEDSISKYFSQLKHRNTVNDFNNISRRGSGFARIISIKITDSDGKEKINFSIQESIRFHINFKVLEQVEEVYVLIGIRNSEGNQFVTTTPRYMVSTKLYDQQTSYTSIIEIAPELRPGEYPLYFWLGNKYTHAYDVIDNKVSPLLIYSNSSFEEIGYDASSSNGFFSISSHQIS
jgi:lipopolysaccharide transport system ATP-binding protein